MKEFNTLEKRSFDTHAVAYVSRVLTDASRLYDDRQHSIGYHSSAPKRSDCPFR
jgi:hypothetical protein